MRLNFDLLGTALKEATANLASKSFQITSLAKCWFLFPIPYRLSLMKDSLSSKVFSDIRCQETLSLRFQIIKAVPLLCPFSIAIPDWFFALKSNQKLGYHGQSGERYWVRLGQPFTVI